VPSKRPHKYRAQPTVIDGIRFASKAESRRYQELKLLEKAGEIKELEIQPKFPIYVCRRQNGELHEAFKYVADFRYREGPQGALVIEDVKGTRTRMYSLKKKAFELQYGIQIRETR
jgi:hypothetical protein